MKEIFDMVQRVVLREISLSDIIGFEWFSDRYFLSKQLTADILLKEAAFNDIPKELYKICGALV